MITTLDTRLTGRTLSPVDAPFHALTVTLFAGVGAC